VPSGFVLIVNWLNFNSDETTSGYFAVMEVSAVVLMAASADPFTSLGWWQPAITDSKQAPISNGVIFIMVKMPAVDS
jgi:hypothetical protein